MAFISEPKWVVRLWQTLKRPGREDIREKYQRGLFAITRGPASLCVNSLGNSAMRRAAQCV